MPWVYSDTQLGYLIVKDTPFSHHLRRYDPFTESIVHELQQGLPFTVPEQWNHIENRNGRIFATYKEQLYDITEISSQLQGHQ